MRRSGLNIPKKTLLRYCVTASLACWAAIASAQPTPPQITAVTDRYIRSSNIAQGGLALIRGRYLSIQGSKCPIPIDAWPLSAPECGFTVLLNDQPIPIASNFEVDGFNQILVQIPYEDGVGAKVALGPAEFKVQVEGETSEPFAVEIKKFQPTVALNREIPLVGDLPFGSFIAVRDSREFEIVPQSPAEPGEVLTVTVDGIGHAIPFVPEGIAGSLDSPSVAAITPTILIQDQGKGIREVELVSATTHRYRAGLYELKFIVPPDLPPAADYIVIVQVEDGSEVFASEPVLLPVGDIGQQITGVLDAAAFGDLISPGSLASVFGLFATENIMADGIPLGLEENGLSITFDGIPAGILNVTQLETFDQANVHVPSNIDVSDGKVDVQIHRSQKGDSSSESFEVNAALASPGIYVFDAAGRAIIQNVSLGNDDVIHGSFAHLENSLGTAFGEQPAVAGGVVTIWCNGLGPVNGFVGTGDVPGLESELLIPTKAITVTIERVPATILGTPVLHPTLVGTFQINVRIPEQLVPNEVARVQIDVDIDGTTVSTPFGSAFIATRAKP